MMSVCGVSPCVTQSQAPDPTNLLLRSTKYPKTSLQFRHIPVLVVKPTTQVEQTIPLLNLHKFGTSLHLNIPNRSTRPRLFANYELYIQSQTHISSDLQTRKFNEILMLSKGCPHGSGSCPPSVTFLQFHKKSGEFSPPGFVQVILQLKVRS